MSSLAPDTHFGALQQKANDCGRDATACDFDILPMSPRGWPSRKACFTTGGKRDGADVDRARIWDWNAPADGCLRRPP